LNFRFGKHFRQEDRICRKGVKKKLKPETGDRKGRGGLLVASGGSGDFG
jgi:hypothetical protein